MKRNAKAEGTWNGLIGYTAQICAWDHGEPADGQDEYALDFSIANGNLVYAILKGPVDGGNIQIHPLSGLGSEGLGSCDE